MLDAQHKKVIVCRTSRQACLLRPYERHLTGRLRLYVTDRWPTRTSSVYNCEVANPACRKKVTLGYPPMAVCLVGGGWWWGHQSFITGSKWAAIFPLT